VWFLIGEIFVALLIAAVIGLVVGWLLGWVTGRASRSGGVAGAGSDAAADGVEAQLAERDVEIERLRAELAPYRSDDLKLINGIGPVFERTLNAMGYSTFDQVAAWTREEIRAVAAEIDLFPDRIIRDRWVEQAEALMARSAAHDDGQASESAPEEDG